LRELRGLGICALEFRGKKKISGVPILGKGCVGIVTVAQAGSERMALKIRRLDADRSTMRHEADMLAKANAVGIGPRLCKSSKNFLLTEFVDGELLPEWLRRRRGKKATRKVLHELLIQCRRLDRIGLDHGELSHAPKHVIVDGYDMSYIVDFETASMNRRPSNLTSMCQYLFISGFVADRIARLLGKTNKDKVIAALRRYKKTRNEECFEQVLAAVGL
jgi:putative serine/threonine protein kinase